MFAKLLVIILAIGGTACALLVVRQQRVELSHDVAQTHNRILKHERVIWDLRTEIAARCKPSDVRKLVEQSSGEWRPIPEAPNHATVPALTEDPLMPGVIVTATPLTTQRRQ